MLRFEVGADLFPGVIGRYALALERERSRTDFGDQGHFRRHERTIPGSAMVGQDMCGVEAVSYTHLDVYKRQVWAQVKAPVDSSKFELQQVWFASKDGTCLLYTSRCV